MLLMISDTPTMLFLQSVIKTKHMGNDLNPLTIKTHVFRDIFNQ